MQPTEPVSSPFRQKIFSLMSQQQPSKVIKLSQKLHNKTINSSHSPFKQYSMDTEMAEETKLGVLDTSSGVKHFKSLQQKLGLKNVSNQKSRGKQSSSKSAERHHKKQLSKDKKVSFIENPSKFYYNPSKSKSKSKTKKSIKKQFSLSNSSHNLKKASSPKHKHISKASSNKSLHKSQKNLKPHQTENNVKKPCTSTHEYMQSTDKQTEKKNYLLQTLKKMESVRKNLTKTFQQFDQENHKNQSFNDEFRQKKKSKEKSKSNLTVISDFVNEESESMTSYKVKNNGPSKLKKSKSKHRLFESTRKQKKQKSPSPDFFHKKTPSKNKYIMSQQSFTQKSQKFSSQKQKLPIDKYLLKQIISSCKNPQKWQTILQNQLISVHFRIVKRKLIEIEIHAEQMLQNLDIQMEKGGLICQSLKEKYENVRKKEIITLLCSVRGVDISNEDVNFFVVPKLLVSISTKLEENSITFKKEVDLPYTWVMLIEKENKQKMTYSSSKKSFDQSFVNRVKTRSTLENISIPKSQKYPNLLEILSFYEKENKRQKSAKKQRKKLNSSTSKIITNSSINKSEESDQFWYAFELQEQQFKLFVKLNQLHSGKSASTRNTYNLELQGKGETLMGKMLLFLELLA